MAAVIGNSADAHALSESVKKETKQIIDSLGIIKENAKNMHSSFQNANSGEIDDMVAAIEKILLTSLEDIALAQKDIQAYADYLSSIGH